MSIWKIIFKKSIQIAFRIDKKGEHYNSIVTIYTNCNKLAQKRGQISSQKLFDNKNGMLMCYGTLV